MSPAYSTLWGYYGYGWGGAYVPGYTERNTYITVETTIYSVPRNQLLWAAVSETRDPKTLQKFVEDLVAHYVAGKSLDRRFAWEIILGARRALARQDSLADLVLEDGMTVDIIGDTHGQFFDLVHLFSLTGPPSATHCMLFNGDFVDRGSWSIEVCLTLFAWKWLYPETFLLNRGNHEAADMNKVYGFEGECKAKYSEKTYALFTDAFTACKFYHFFLSFRG